MPLALIALLGPFVFGPTASSRKGAKPPCPGGRFVLGDAVLPAPASPSAADTVDIAGSMISIWSGCAPVAVKLTGSKRGTAVKATWPTCRGVPGKVALKGMIDPTCGTLSATVTARKARPKLKRKFTAPLTASGVRFCDYVPGQSQPAAMPPEASDRPVPSPPPALPTSTPVPPETTARQVDVLDELWNIVDQVYVYPDFNGRDWTEIGNRYLALVQQGLTDADFYTAMERMIAELGDNHSQYLSPQGVVDQERQLAEGASIVGIGAQVVPIPGTQSVAVIIVFPNSPAAEAGLRPHDNLLAVDGLPVVDESGTNRLRGPAGSTFTLTFQRPGAAPQTIALTRRAITGNIPIDYCTVPHTRIGYVLVPTVFDLTIDDQTRTALQKMTTDAPLEGLVIDNRLNGGGTSLVARPFLGFFTSGIQGYQVSRTRQQEFSIDPEDIGGSQSAPLAVLTDSSTVSFGEIISGVLQVSGRAVVVGERSAGNVELLVGYDLRDASRVWIAFFSFQPLGLPSGVWEGTGIVPDVPVPTRWDLFTEATDPALAQAVTQLQARSQP